MKPPYLVEVAAKPYPVGDVVPKFQKRKHDGACCVDPRLYRCFHQWSDLCMREFLKTPTDRAYTWMLTWNQVMCTTMSTSYHCSYTKFFCAEVKFSFVELDRTRQHPDDDLDMYLRRFHERALKCYDLVSEEVLVNVCLRGMLEKTNWRISLRTLLEICLYELFLAWWKWLIAPTSPWTGPRGLVQQFNPVLVPWFN